MRVVSISTVVSFIITLGFLSNIADSLQLDLESGNAKCISEDIRSESMSVGKYHVVNPNKGHPLPESHNLTVKVTSPTGTEYHRAENVTSGQFNFHAYEAGVFYACFWVVEHKPSVTLTLDFDWRTGMYVQEWSNVASKGSVDVMQQELNKMQEVITSIHEDMVLLRDREQKIRSFNINTNSTMGWLGFLSLCVCLSVAGLQFWHLKTFFEKEETDLEFSRFILHLLFII